MHHALLIALTTVLIALAGCSSNSNNSATDGDHATRQPSHDAATHADTDAAAMAEDPANATGPLEFTVQDIDGHDVALGDYRGRVVLIVNVASRCGLTPQYEALQDLHEQYADEGLAILGFPANDFRGQEPGTNAEIKTFCTATYGVEFDMFSKVVVTGPDKCPLYAWLTSSETNPDFAGELQWNFTKFLVDRDGRVIARFEPRVRPDDPQVVRAIEAALRAEG